MKNNKITFVVILLFSIFAMTTSASIKNNETMVNKHSGSLDSSRCHYDPDGYYHCH